MNIRSLLKIVIAVTMPLVLWAGAGQASVAADGQWSKTCASTTSCIIQYGSGSFKIDTGNKGGPLAVAHLSTNALLPFGMTWQIDGQKPIRVPFWKCNDGTCYAQLVINGNYLDLLRGGSILHISAKDDNGNSGRSEMVNISLKGFGPAYDGK